MADTNVSLGIEVTTTGAKEAAQDLEKLNASAKNVAKSTTDLGAAQRQTVSATKGAAAAQDALGKSTTAAGQSTSAFRSMFGGLAGLFGPYGRGAAGAASSMGLLAGAHGDLANSMRLLNTIAYSTGGSIAGLGQVARLARGGLVFLAAGIAATVIVSLERAADKIGIVKERLQSLLGTSGGKNAFDQVKQSTDAANNSIGAYLGGIEAVTRALAAQSTFKTITKSPGGGWNVTSGFPGANSPASAAAAMSQALQLDKKTAEAAGQAVEGYLQTMAKYNTETKTASGLTAELFHAWTVDSPRLSAAMSKASGFGEDIAGQARFEDSLRLKARTIEETLRKVQGFAPEFAAAYAKMEPDVGQGFDRLTTAIGKLWGELGKGDTVAGQIFGAITSYIDGVNQKIQKGQGLVSALFSPPQGWSTMFSQANDLIDAMIGKLKIATDKKNELAASQAGALAGALTGAGVGAVVGGSILGPVGAVGGAAVGGAVGALGGGVAGGAIGRAIDEINKSSDAAAPRVVALATDVTKLGISMDVAQKSSAASGVPRGWSDQSTFLGRSGTLDYRNPDGSRTIAINDVFDPQAYGSGRTSGLIDND